MSLDGKAKRVEEVQNILHSFIIEFSAEIPSVNTFSSRNTAITIVDNYELLLDNVIDSFLQDKGKEQRRKADIFKVCAGLEYACLYSAPIKSNDPTININVNALLSFYLAKKFLMQERSLMKFDVSSLSDRELDAIEKMHLNLLRYSTMNNFYDVPIFSNAIFWRTYCHIISLKIQYE